MMKKLNLWLDTLKHDACPALDECTEMLGDLLPWLNDFKSTPQDPQWHSEGNVYIHTDMVLEECYQLLKNDAAHLSDEYRQALILAALLHDIAKPVSTMEREIKGIVRVVSPKHESKGRSYLAHKLPKTNLSENVIQLVLDLVGEHHQPKFLVIKNAPSSAYYRLARQVPLELLYFLEVADMRGRICADRVKQLEVMEEFKMFAQEYGLWRCLQPYALLAQPLNTQLEELSKPEQDYVLLNAIYEFEQNHIFQLEEALGKTFEHRGQYSHLVVLYGPSGSGKSSWIARHLPDYELVSLDKFREQLNGKRSSQKNAGQVLQAAKEALRVSLRNKNNVVWDATSLRKDFRDAVIGLALDYHALVSLVVFRQDEQQLSAKNANRTHPVSPEVLEKQLSSAQWPTLAEAHHYSVIGREGDITFQSPQLQKQPFCSNS